MAGIPKAVVHRAEEVLKELEERQDSVMQRADAAMQLSFFPEDDALREELANLDEFSLSPLEALNKLFELAEKSKEAKGKRRR